MKTLSFKLNNDNLENLENFSKILKKDISANIYEYAKRLFEVREIVELLKTNFFQNLKSLRNQINSYKNSI